MVGCSVFFFVEESFGWCETETMGGGRPRPRFAHVCEMPSSGRNPWPPRRGEGTLRAGATADTQVNAQKKEKKTHLSRPPHRYTCRSTSVAVDPARLSGLASPRRKCGAGTRLQVVDIFFARASGPAARRARSAVVAAVREEAGLGRDSLSASQLHTTPLHHPSGPSAHFGRRGGPPSPASPSSPAGGGGDAASSLNLRLLLGRSPSSTPLASSIARAKPSTPAVRYWRRTRGSRMAASWRESRPAADPGAGGGGGRGCCCCCCCGGDAALVRRY